VLNGINTVLLYNFLNMIKIKCLQEKFENYTGIYYQKNKINGKCYIGSTVMAFMRKQTFLKCME
jgi:hypothetical protein